MSDEPINCPFCPNQGWFEGALVAECCGQPHSNGECCGDPIPVQTQEQCQFCLETKNSVFNNKVSEDVAPKCKCGEVCQNYGETGGYSVKCKKCNEANAKRPREARARRLR